MSYSLARLISFLFDALTFLILLDIIGSWMIALRVRLPSWGYNIMSAVRRLTDVFLGPIRRLIPSFGGLDISPIIALILLDVLRRLVLSALIR